MRSSHSLAFCLFLAGAAQAQDLNVISSVEVKDEGNSVLVTVKGSKPPNFTTFSMADPARFVIDLSEARFQGVPEDLRVDDGVVRVVKNLAYGSGATAIARVMIAFSVDVEPPDVQANGSALLVRVVKPGGGAVASGTAGPADAAASASAGAPEAAAGGAVAVAAADAARSEADEAARQEALAREQVDAEAREQVRRSGEATAREREAQAQLEAAAKASEAERLAAQQAAEEEAARAAAAARSAEIKAKAAEVAGPPAEPVATGSAVAVAATAGPTAAELAATAKAEKAAQAQAAAQAKADAKAQAQADAKAKAQAQADAKAQAKADAKAKAQAQAEAQAQAKADAKAKREADLALAAQHAAEARAAAAASRPARLQAIGFKQLPTVSRVFVKTSATPRFTITDVGDDVVRIEVENTRSTRRNDTRPLDTSFFPSAIAMITPSKIGTSYVVDIKLKKRVPYQQKVEGDLLAIDFERPPTDASSQAAGVAPAAARAGTARTEETLVNEQGLVIAPDDKAADEEAAPEQAPEQAPKQ